MAGEVARTFAEAGEEAYIESEKTKSSFLITFDLDLVDESESSLPSPSIVGLNHITDSSGSVKSVVQTNGVTAVLTSQGRVFTTGEGP